MKKLLKKGLSLLLAILMLMSTMPVSVLAEELVKEYPDFEYETNADGSLTVTGYKGDELFVTVPAQIDEAAVKYISEGAFAENDTLVEVTVCDGIEIIGRRAFADCENLDSVTFPDSVTEIAKDAFEGSDGIKLICNDESEACCFANDNGLECIIISESDDESEFAGSCSDKIDWHVNLRSGLLTVYGKGAIPDYSQDSETPWDGYKESIKSIKLVDNITSIGDYTFAGLDNAVSVMIPESVESIGNYAFYGCGSLEIAVFNGKAPNEFGEEVFGDCTDYFTIYTPLGDAMWSDSEAFDYQTQTWNGYSIVFGEEHVHSYTAEVTEPGCTWQGYTTYTCICGDSYINDYYEPLGHDFFDGVCTRCGLPEGYVTLGKTRLSVMSNVEYGYKFVPEQNGLYSIEADCMSSVDLCVNDSNGDQIYSTDGGSLQCDLAAGEEYTIGLFAWGGESAEIDLSISYMSNKCGDDLTWSFNNGVLTISGTGDMWDYDWRTAPWYSVIDSISSIVLPEGLTRIGVFAFLDCGNLTSITIPDGVESIGDYVFCNCFQLADVNIPDTVTSIGDRVFTCCHGLTNIFIPDSVTYIGSGAFASCSSITNISVGSNNKYYSSEDGVLFDYDKTVLMRYPAARTDTSYTIPESVESIGEGAFSEWRSLKSMSIPSGVVSIGSEAFFGCRGLASMSIPSGVVSIGRDAFSGCRGLTSIFIPDSVESIGYGAFMDDNSLKNVFFSGSADAWNSINAENIKDYLTDVNIHYNVADPATHYVAEVTSEPTCTECGYSRYTCDCGYSYEGASSNPLGHVFVDGVCTRCGVREGYVALGNTMISIPANETVVYKFAPEESGYYCFTTISNDDTFGELNTGRGKQLTSNDDSGKDLNFRIIYYLEAGNEYSIGVRTYNGSGADVTLSISEDEMKCGDDLTWSVADDTLIISGTGDMWDYDWDSAPWYSVRDSVKSVVLPEGLASIGDYAFECCYILENVMYSGDEDEWNNIDVGECNDRLLSVNVHYNAADPATHFVATELSAPTCTEMGRYSYSCDCGYSFEADVPALGHDFVDGVCTRCGAREAYVSVGETEIYIPGENIIYCKFVPEESGDYRITTVSEADTLGELYDINGYCLTSNDDSGKNYNFQMIHYLEAGKEYNIGVRSYNGDDLTVTLLISDANKLCGEDLTWSVDNGVLTISGTGDMWDYDGEAAPWYQMKYSITSVVLSEDLTSIGNCAFFGLEGLTSVNVPDGVTVIGYQAFSGCNSLESLSIPASVMSIGVWLLTGCNNLKSVEIDEENTVYHSAGNCIIDTEEKTLIAACSSSVIPDDGSVTRIGEWAFSESNVLESITIPDSVTGISNGAFWHCDDLESITIPANVMSIGMEAFSCCESLASIVVDEDNTAYHSAGNCLIETESKTLIQGCSESVIPADGSVTRIDAYAFEGNYASSSINIPVGVDSIGYGAFGWCSALEQVVFAGNAPTKFENDVFVACPDTLTLYVPTGDTTWTDSYAYDAEAQTWNGYPIEFYEELLPEGYVALGQTNITVPGGETAYSKFVPKRSGVYCFTTIGNDDTNGILLDSKGNELAYDYDSGENYNFSIIYYLEAGKEYAIGVNTYNGSDTDVTLSISKDDMKCGDDLTASFADGVLTISGTGDMWDFEDIDIPWYAVMDRIETLELPEGLTSIGYGAFNGCTGLTCVSIPDSVTSINAGAFTLTGLESIYIPAGVKNIGDSVFLACESLTEIAVDVDNEVYHSSDNCLIETESKTLIQGCSESVIPADGSVTSIGTGAFGGITGLESISIPDCITGIGNAAFTQCTALESVELPDGITNISDALFSMCSGLTSVVIPDSVTSIGQMSFAYCASLKDIELPAGVDSIGYGAFAMCDTLERVVFAGNAPSQFGTSVFDFCGENFTICAPIGDTTWTDSDAYDAEAQTWNGYPIEFYEEQLPEGYIALGQTDITVPADETAYSKFVPENSGLYCFTTIGNNDTYGVLLDSEGNELAHDDDSGENYNFQIIYYLEAGKEYSVGVRTYNGSDTDVTLSISEEEMKCGDNLTWSFDDGVLTISGTGDMWDYASNNMSTTAPWFAYASEITSVEISDGVTSIGDFAFAYCTVLAEINIPDSVTSIGRGAFGYCSALTGISIPDGVTSIGEAAFAYCTGLAEINIPDSVTSISRGTFGYCTALTNISIPDGVTSIGEIAFILCTALSYIEIPDSVENIDNNAFAFCTALENVLFSGSEDEWNSITFESENNFLPNVYIHYNAADFASHCTVVAETEATCTSAHKTSYTCDCGRSFVIRKSAPLAHDIVDGVCTCCGLREGYIAVGESDVVLPANEEVYYKFVPEKSGTYCFTASGSIGIAGGLLDSDGNMLAYDDYHEDLSNFRFTYYLEAGKEYTIGAASVLGSELGIDVNATLSISEAEAKCGDDLTWSLDDGVLTISGTGDMWDYMPVDTFVPTPWIGCASEIKSVEISDGVTSIGSFAFIACTGLTEINIPDSVTSIGMGAFDACAGLSYIVIPDSVESIGENAFALCNALENVFFGGSEDEWNSIYFESGNYFLTNAYIHYNVPDFASHCTAVAETEATCNRAHSVSYICNCGHSFEVTAPAPLAHDFVDGVCAHCGLHEGYVAVGENNVILPAYEEACYKFVPEKSGSYCFTASGSVGIAGVLSDSDGNELARDNYHDDYSNFKITYYLEAGKEYTIGAVSELSSELGIDVNATLTIYAPVAECGDELTWSLDDGVLKISGTGDMYDFVSGNTPWSDHISEITSIEIADGVTSIGEYAFAYCDALTSVSIPERVTNIGNSAFYGCYDLATAYFTGSEDAWNSIAIGNNNYYLTWAFIHYNFTDPETHYATEVIAPTCTEQGYTRHFCACGDSYEEDYVDPLGHDFVYGVCSRCGSHDGYAILGDNLISIPSNDYSFNKFAPEKSGIYYFTTTGSTDTVGRLTDSEGNQLAYNDDGGAGRNFWIAYYLIADKEYSIDVRTYGGGSASVTLTVSRDEMKCGDDLTWSLDNGVLTISGTGDMYNYSAYSAPWNAYASQITAIEISDGVTGIGSYAFYDCNNILNVTIPEKVTVIGNCAFANCDKLESIEVSVDNAVYHSADNCLIETESKTLIQGCKNSIIPADESVESIGSYAFCGCNGISGELVIPDSVTVINNYAFSDCTGLTSLVIGEKATSIFVYAFNKDNAIKEIVFKGTTVPNSCKFVSYANGSLETVHVPSASYKAYVDALTPYVGNAAIVCDFIELPVEGLTVDARFSNTISLSWQKHIFDGITGYIVKRDGEEIARTHECRYDDIELPGGEYTYAVCGYTEEGSTTPETTITASTADPELIELHTNYPNNTVAVTDGQIFISARNKLNAFDLEGNEIKGRLYYLDANGDRVFIGSSVLDADSASEETLVYSVNWDVTDIAAGEYTVVFVFEDPDGAVAELESTVNVNKSIPEKIVNVIAVGDFTKINLSWAQSSEVDTTIYKIYRMSDAESEFALLKTINGRTTLTYSDTNVDKEHTYSYYIVAVNSYGVTSEPSDIAVGMIATDTEAPTVTKFSPGNGSYISGQQTITVSAVDNLMPVMARLYYSVDEGESWILAGEDTAAPFNFSFDTTAVDDGKVTFNAYAYDAQGNESLPMSCVYYVDNTGPEKVTGLEAINVLTSKITLKWNNVSDSDAAYFILQQKDGDSYRTIASSITTLGYNVSNLSGGTEYTFAVAAVDARGNVGTYSDDFSVTTVVDDIAPVVTDLSPDPGRYNDYINFRASASDDCGIKSITVQISTDRENWTDLSTANYTDCKASATYYYTVSLDDYSDGSIYLRAVAEDFSGNLSDTSDLAPFVEYIVDKTSPDKPRDLLASGGDGWIYVSWLQGSESDLGTYQLYRSTSEDGAYSLIASGLSKVNYYDTSVQRDTVYYYKLRVLDTTGNLSDFTDPVSAKVADDVTAPEVVSINPASGSVIGPTYKTVEALVRDNNCIDSIVFEYKVNDETEFRTLEELWDVGYYYTTARTELPVNEFSDGDRIYIRVFATDTVGLSSEYSSEYVYHVDKVAPTLSELNVELEENSAKITWQNAEDSDVSGYKVYRVNSNGTFTALGSRAYTSKGDYTFYDNLRKLGNGFYSYKVEAYDKVGNFSSFFTDSVHYEKEVVEQVNQAPIAVINGFKTMEIGVEEFFDAGYSEDDRGIVSYLWDFGDGTSSDQVKAIKKYDKTGTYTVMLTVTDTDGESATDTMTVTVNERTTVGTVRVNVVDENGNTVPNAPVYFDLGAEGQKKVYTNQYGTASILMDKGEHVVGVYKDGYLPVQKNVTVLPNATRIVTMTVIKQEIVTGEFEVTRMTFSEIKAAGIDVYAPENQNVYEVRVTLKYGTVEVPLTYIRNDFKIIDFNIGNGGGKVDDDDDDKPPRPGPGGGGNGDGIIGITFIPNKENKEIIAVLQMDVKASYLKEFFDVRLHIINNASPEFRLTDNTVHLNVPDGLTMMTGISGDWNQTADVTIDAINGQETKSLAWVLRGDKEGEYDLSADFNGTLEKFNEPISAVFKTEQPIKVYGLKDFKVVLDVNSEIAYNAFYFNIGLENNGSIDLYNPQLDFNGIVKNITASAMKKEEGINSEEKKDFDIESNLINVRFVNAAGESMYIPFTVTDKTIDTGIDTLAPGEALYYEYVAYNMINYDGTAYFIEAATEQLSEYGGTFEVNNRDFNLYNTSTVTNKLEAGTLDQNAVDYITNNSNFYYYETAKNTNSSSVGRIIYNCGDVIFNFNWDVITGEDKEKLAESILLKILVSQDTMDNIDDLIDAEYVTAVKSYLSLLKDQINDRIINYDDYFKVVRETYWYSGTDKPIQSYGLYPVDKNGNPIIEDELMEEVVYEEGKANLYQWADIINGFLGNYQTIDKLAQSLKKQGVSTFNNVLLDEGAKIGLAAGMSYINWSMRDLLTDNEIVDQVSKQCKYASKILSYSVLNPIKAINEASYNQAIYNAIQMNACIEEELLILDMVIDYCKYADSPFEDEILKVAQDYKEIAEGRAYSFAADVYDQYFKITAESIGTDVAKFALNKGLKAISSKACIIYELLSLSFNILDEKLKWGEYYKCQDGMDITECLSTAFLEAWKFGKVSYSMMRDFDKAVYATHALKYLTQTRLLGESQFKTYIQNVDEDFIEEVNKELKTNYEDVEEFYDVVYKKLLSARDTLFTDKPTTPAVKPAAPAVSFNYDTMTTNEVFDDSYEYCLSDGEWIRCSGEPIAVKLKTHGTVLRVRVASGGSTVAGEITTLNLYAQREFSKVVNVKYDNGTYYFNNLVSDYDYQICPLSTEYETPDWSNSKTFRGSPDASVKFDFGEYLAIRTCANDELKETASKVRVLPVQTRQTLTVNVWGNGEVSQSNDSGMYFIGDDIRLTARPVEGAVFKGWFAGGELLSISPEYILEMYNNADITAKFEGGEIVNAESVDLVLVNANGVCDIASGKFFENGSAKLIAYVQPQNAADKSVTWTSSNKNAAIVDSFGVVNFIAPGSGSITATLANGKSASYSFTVVENSITGIYIAEPAVKTVYFENEDLDLDGLKLMAMYSNGKAEEITEYTVGGYDLTAGEKTVTLTYNGLSTQFTVTTVHKPQWLVTKASSCAEAGIESEVCTVCGQTLRTRELPLKEHSFEWVVTKPATSEENGIREYKCSVCGYVESSETIKWCDHNYEKVVTEPGCVTEGYTTYTCTECGDSYVSDIVAAIGHDYSERVIAPSCGKTGYTLHTCANCGHQYASDYVKALEHSYVETVVAPTCTEEGYTEYKCEYCGDTYKSDYTAKVSHSYTAEVVEATCEHEGYTLYTCEMCHDSFKSDETPKLEHNYTSVEKNGNCTEGSYIIKTCTECGHEEIIVVAEPTEHTPGEWHVEHEAGCETDGLKVLICTQCNELIASEIIPARGHDFNVTVVNPTCTDEGYTQHACKNCSYSYTDDVKPPFGHIAGEWVTVNDASCTEPGLRCKYCTRCKIMLEEEIIEATGHLHTHWDVITEADCTNYGFEKLKCDDCGNYIDSSVIAPLGHSYDKGICSRCGAIDPNYKPEKPDCRIEVSGDRARAGEEVGVSVILDTNPGIAEMALDIVYDESKLELLGIEDGTFEGWTLSGTELRFVNGNSTNSGVILKLKFKVLDSADEGDIEVSLKAENGDILDHDSKLVVPEFVSGMITVFTFHPGDVNGDGAINALDLIRLRKYLSGADVELVGNADVNADGRINALDLVRLQKYISGADVKLLGENVK